MSTEVGKAQPLEKPEIVHDVPACSPMTGRERLIISAMILSVGLVFFLPCLLQKNLVAIFSSRVGPGLAASIPEALLRYKIWIAVVSASFAVFHHKILIVPGEFKEKLLCGFSFSVLLNLLIFMRAWQFPYCIDDAYIVFRIVDNALTFGAPDFNPGVHINAIASQLHFVLLTLVCFLTGSRDIPVVAQSINLAQEIASLFVLFALLKQLFKRADLALLGCATHVMSAYTTLEVMRGKEGSAMMLLLYLYIYAQITQRERLKAWATALVCLTRSEGFLLLALTLSFEALRGGEKLKERISRWGPPLTLIALFLLCVGLYNGTIIPQGFLVKANVYHAPLLMSASYLVAHLLSCFSGMPFYFEGFMSLAALFGIYAVLTALLWPYQPLRCYLLSLLGVTVFFVCGNALFLVFPWYLSWWAPLTPLAIVVLVKNIRNWRFPAPARRTLQAFVIIYCLVFIPYHVYEQPAMYAHVYSPMPVFYWDNVNDRLRIYEEARNYIDAVGSSNQTTAVAEVGIFSYKFKQHVFDLLAMVTPEALKLYPVPVEKRAFVPYSIPPQYARLYKPERMLFLDSMAQNGLLDDEYFKSNYEMEKFWETDVFDSAGVCLYKRKDVSSHQSAGGRSKN